MDAQAERKKLVAKQQNDIKAMEKDVKKKKGFLKEEAQKKMEETQARFEKELAEFDEKNGTSETNNKEKEKEKEKAPLKVFEERDFATMGRSELDEECVLRGISKKGSKEQLVTRLVENLLAAKQQKEAQAKEGGKKEAPKAAPAKPAATVSSPKPTIVKAAPKPAPKKKEESESEDEEEEDGDSDSEEMTEEEKAKAAKFAKVEQVVQKSLIKLLQRYPKGLSTEVVAERLAEIGVKNFRPDVVGYKTLHDFFDNQPEQVLQYEASEQMVYPSGTKKK